MKAGSVSSLQIWIYKLEDRHTVKAENRLQISVAKVIREGVESGEGPEKKKLLISMMHEGDAGWMGRTNCCIHLYHKHRDYRSQHHNNQKNQSSFALSSQKLHHYGQN